MYTKSRKKLIKNFTKIFNALLTSMSFRKLTCAWEFKYLKYFYKEMPNVEKLASRNSNYNGTILSRHCIYFAYIRCVIRYARHLKTL